MPLSRPRGSLARRIAISGVLLSAGVILVSGTRQLVDTEGLDCQDYGNAEWAGSPVARRIQRDLTAPLLGTPLRSAQQHFSTACEGWLFVTTPVEATFLLESDDGSDLSIDGASVVDNHGRHGPEARRGAIVLLPGPRAIRIRYSQDGGEYAFSLLWGPQAGPLRPLAQDDLSRRPLSRAEHSVRPWARSLCAASLLLLVALLAYIWRQRLLHLASVIAPRIAGAHHAITAGPHRALMILLVVAIAARVVLTVTTHAVVWPDSFSYYAATRDMLGGNWTSHEIFRTPGFSAFMAFFLSAGETPAIGLTMVAVQRVLGVLATVVAYLIARRAFSAGTAFYGTLLWTISPLQLYYETAVLSEALFVFLLLLTIWTAVRLSESTHATSFAVVGLLCGLAVLTRPVAKGLVFVVVAVVWRYARTPRRRLALSTAVLAAYLLCTVPWMYVNDRTFGFFGISRGEGLGLFMRAFDIERLPFPNRTQYPEVAQVVSQLASVPYLHYRVRDELDYGRRYSALATDRVMAGFSMEAIQAHPFAYAVGVGLDWFRLFVSPHRSVGLCDDPSGPVLCAVRSQAAQLPAFPNHPTAGFTRLKAAVAAYMGPAYWLTPLLAPVAWIGGLLVLGRPARRESQFARALLLATIVYFSIASVSFNTVEDRYRLPVDAFILLFAVHAAAEAGSLLRRSPQRSTEPRWRVDSAA